jgi:hypothetical protein
MFCSCSCGTFAIVLHSARLLTVGYRRRKSFSAIFCGVRAATVTRSVASRPKSSPILSKLRPSPLNTPPLFMISNSSFNQSITSAVGRAKLKNSLGTNLHQEEITPEHLMDNSSPSQLFQQDRRMSIGQKF